MTLVPGIIIGFVLGLAFALWLREDQEDEEHDALKRKVRDLQNRLQEAGVHSCERCSHTVPHDRGR